jgi:uncharacterized protein (TIGR02145 family)
MAKKRAFVRYSKNGKLVPGSLIVTQGSHPNGPSTWKEVPADLCCGDANCTPFCTENWMFENLDVITFRNGDPIPHVTDPAQWATLTTPAWCYYNNNSANGMIYGKLYNGYAVTDPRGLAPEGWRIPTVNDWTNLIECVGGFEIAGNKLKTTGQKFDTSVSGLWNFESGATNDYGFSALPSGIRNVGDGNFYSINEFAFWWTSTEIDSNNLHNFFVRDSSSNIAQEFIGTSKNYGYSIRLIKDI